MCALVFLKTGDVGMLVSRVTVCVPSGLEVTVKAGVTQVRSLSGSPQNRLDWCPAQTQLIEYTNAEKSLLCPPQLPASQVCHN